MLSSNKFFSHPEGYVEPSTNGFDYVYQYKDHLGNIRLSYKQEGLEADIDDFNDGTTGNWSAYESPSLPHESFRVVIKKSN